MEKILTCINCPMGCQISVELDDDKKIVDIKNYSCKRGKDYAIDELTNPTRMVTSIIRVEDSSEPLSVKTRSAIPKQLVFDCLKEIRKTAPKMPIKIGDIIIENVCNTNIDVIATRNLP